MSNQAAWLDSAGARLRLGPAPMPEAGEGEIVIRNRAVAINPIDNLQARAGTFVQRFPAVLGQDVAGEVVAVGAGVGNIKEGDRVMGHAWAMKTGEPTQAGFARYTRVPARNAAVIPAATSFAAAAVMPLALDSAIAALYGPAGILDLPLPSADGPRRPSAGVMLVYGGSSSIGLCATQLAVASGVRVIALASPANHALCKRAGADEVFDYRAADVVERVVGAVRDGEAWMGIFDAIADEGTYAHDFAIIAKLGGRGAGKIASSHAPPEHVAEGVEMKWFFGLGDYTLHVWDAYVGQAIRAGQLKFMPEPLVVGHGLESVQKGMERQAAGVSAQKVVIEL